MAETIVLAGAVAQKPRRGGHAWVFLQYLLGFKRLGWDVLFLDRLDPEMSVDSVGRSCPVDQSTNLRSFLAVMDRFGLSDAFALICDNDRRFIGLSRQRVLQRIENCACFFNVMGFITDREILECAPRRVFLDIDPGIAQFWHDSGLVDLFRGHNAYVTIGENIGQPDCTIPTCGLTWILTRQPVVLERWPAVAGGNGRSFTSVASWRGSYGSFEHRGKHYGVRAHEFRRFVEMPRLSGRAFQVALDIHPADATDIALLAANGWSLADPQHVAGTPWDYQRYIQGSWAEFMVAKNLCVRAHSGWFSDRSVCYLASGKPVLAQDTGLKQLYPPSDGLLTFTTLDEALAGVRELSQNYVRHARAARALAEEHFDSDIVLGRLLQKLGVS